MERYAAHSRLAARRRWLCALLLLPLVTLVRAIAARGLSAPTRAERTTAAYAYVAPQSPDVVVAGGLDGRVYAVNAWSGDVLWSFDSGGPMVDSSQCVIAETQPATTSPSDAHQCANSRGKSASSSRPSRSAAVDVDGSVHVAEGDEPVEDRIVVQEQTASERAVAATTAFMAQLVPSYDGRLYQFSESKVTELEMTMADLVNVNGPVRLAVDASEDDARASGSDILLFGEKHMEMFTLDALSGLRRPSTSDSAASSASSTALWSKEILFGRSEFTTRAVHARNSSAARCFKISEFFLDFAKQAHCSSMGDDHNAAATHTAPEILVVPKDPETGADDEGSTIVAFDPWTSEQLWEFVVPDFDVLAVYGVSTTRGSTFYQWKVDGPSSSLSSKKVRDPESSHSSKHVAAGESYQHQRIEAGAQHEEGEDETRSRDGSLAAKQLTRVVPHTWNAIKSRFRLRLLGDHYFLESNNDDAGATSLHGSRALSPPRSSFLDRYPSADSDDMDEELVAGRRRRRIFWEPIVNDGKSGVFITYYHVGAMFIGVTLACILLAWGCYVKGLSASLAQSAIKSMDNSQFFVSHMHRLTIERPGEEDITISSVISRSLMMEAVGGVERPLALLENGELMDEEISTELSVKVDPETEAMLMKKFSRLVANEAASMLARGNYPNSKLKVLEVDPGEDSNATTVTSGSSFSSSSELVFKNASTSSSLVRLPSRGPVATKRLALTYAEEDYLSRDDKEAEAYEVKMLPVVDDTDLVSSDAELESEQKCFELIDSDDDMFFVADDESVATTTSGPKSASSMGESDTTGSCRSNESGGETTSKSHSRSNTHYSRGSEDASTSSKRANADKSSAREEESSSASSSSGSSSSEAEVLFPFVCQSRFANEFVELSAIGKGGFGQVMLAENRLDGRNYAIKRVGLNLKNQTSKTLQKFLREVKILALLDHPNIVRYYQAWLEKVEKGAKHATTAPPLSSRTNSLGHLAEARDYSTSNLLAPISELEFSGNQRQPNSFYSNGSVLDDDDVDDGGFEWDRGSSSGDNDNGWKEEDLVVQNKPRTRNAMPPPALSASAGRSPREELTNSDSSSFALEKCDHWLYIQMQYCAGRSLADYLAVPTRPMQLSRMLKIFVQIASALAHVHSCGLIHRDLKPANIFVADTERDEIKLGDFGLSRYATNANLGTVDDAQGPPSSTGLMDAPLSASQWSASMSNMSESNDVTAGVGTYLYASPEQVAGKKYNAKTDIYSLGMILFELCHERFATTMERYITLRDARECKFPLGLRCTKRCPEILEMLHKLLNQDAATRPTADEVVQWGQMLYETSLAQKALDVVRSPRNLEMARATGVIPPMPTIDHLMTGSNHTVTTGTVMTVTTTFALKVEAAMQHSSGDRLPNHNLLKQVCDVIAAVHDGKVEIKKCGLHLQGEGVQILEFELDPLAALAAAPDSDVEGAVVVAIEALPGVQIVHRAGHAD